MPVCLSISVPTSSLEEKTPNHRAGLMPFLHSPAPPAGKFMPRKAQQKSTKNQRMTGSRRKIFKTGPFPVNLPPHRLVMLRVSRLSCNRVASIPPISRPLPAPPPHAFTPPPRSPHRVCHVDICTCMRGCLALRNLLVPQRLQVSPGPLGLPAKPPDPGAGFPCTTPIWTTGDLWT